jgi:hypothetical protein
LTSLLSLAGCGLLKNQPEELKSDHSNILNIVASQTTMLSVTQTPANYKPAGGERWCILDEDGDVHDFYFTKEEAEEALRELMGT